MKLLRNFAKKIFFFLFFLSFIFLCFSLSNEQVLDISSSTFSLQTPGFEYTINSGNEGKYFELEAALFAQKQMEQNVIGFSLDIDFYIDNKKKCFVYLDGKYFELRTTEFDVVTDDFVFECKLCRNPDEFKKIGQFRKERSILLFFKKIYNDLQRGELWVDVNFKKSKRRRRSVMTIRGEITGNKKVSFTSKWITGKTIEQCLKQWFKVIEILASRSLLVMFKNRITQSLIDKLREQGFEYSDGINYEVYLPEGTEGCFIWNWGIGSLCGLFKRFRICCA